ncbi:MAG: endonuclease domain-containing protein [Verrucomicrobia bacterium]|nr:endonuclease domain-containing protein [Verrucomicrobiota bacterium]
MIEATTKQARALRRRQTEPEKLLWKALRNRKVQGAKFRRQYPEGPYILDFYCLEKKLAVELDGSGHNRSSERVRDHLRDRYLQNEGIRVVRFWNTQIRDNLEGVLMVIASELHESSPHPGPLPQGEGVGGVEMGSSCEPKHQTSKPLHP